MDFESDGKIDHAAMINSIRNNYEILYTAHTKDRYNQELANIIDDNITIHILSIG